MLRPPPPREPIADVAAAVRDALRFPLDGEPLEALVARGARATIVVEPPALPSRAPPTIRASWRSRRSSPSSSGSGSRRAADVARRRRAARRPGRASSAARHARVRAPLSRRRRRARRRARRPRRARRASRSPARVHPRARRDRPRRRGHGGRDGAARRPAALLAAAGAEALRAAGAYSLLETAGSQGWRLALELERALAQRVPLLGVSLALNIRALGGALRGYPYDREALERIATLAIPARCSARCPGLLRRDVLRSLPHELSAAAVFAGRRRSPTPRLCCGAWSCDATELDARSTRSASACRSTTPFLPRERSEPAARLRTWASAWRSVSGATRSRSSTAARRSCSPLHRPSRIRPSSRTARFFRRRARAACAIRAARRGRAAGRPDDARSRALPLGPHVPPAAPVRRLVRVPARDRPLGAVLVAGCRDATAVRQLGFVPCTASGRARDGPRPPSGPARSASCSSRRTSRCASAQSSSLSPRYVCATCSFSRSAFASSASAILPVSST